jgi:hypothetical protein
MLNSELGKRELRKRRIPSSEFKIHTQSRLKPCLEKRCIESHLRQIDDKDATFAFSVLDAELAFIQFDRASADRQTKTYARAIVRLLNEWFE